MLRRPGTELVEADGGLGGEQAEIPRCYPVMQDALLGAEGAVALRYPVDRGASTSKRMAPQ